MRHNQNGFHLVAVSLGLVAIVIIGLTYLRVAHGPREARAPSQSTGSEQSAIGPDQEQYRASQDPSLPDISYFQDHRSDQFIVDWDVMQSGHPYLGARADSPHTGAHMQTGDSYLHWPKGGTAANNYPAIYAVADGIVDMVETSLKVGDNDRYGVVLAVAKGMNFDYSIEPFAKEPSPGFYEQFITVKNGDHVKKGQVIAYMYLPANSKGSHIHFDLQKDNQFMAPDIFTPSVTQSFYNHWGEAGYDGGSPQGSGLKIPLCMGYKLAAYENPFGTGAVDCLE